MKSPYPASSFHSSSSIAARLLASLLLVYGTHSPAVGQVMGMGGYGQQSLQNRAQGEQNANIPEGVIEHVHGVVVSSADNKHIARALVTSNDQRMAMMTDSEGRFAFDLKHPAANSSTATIISSFGQMSTAQMYPVF